MPTPPLTFDLSLSPPHELEPRTPEEQLQLRYYLLHLLVTAYADLSAERADAGIVALRYNKAATASRERGEAGRPSAGLEWVGINWDALSTRTEARLRVRLNAREDMTPEELAAPRAASMPEIYLVVFQLILAYPDIAGRYAPVMLQALRPYEVWLYDERRFLTASVIVDNLPTGGIRFLRTLYRVIRIWQRNPTWRAATVRAFMSTFPEAHATPPTIKTFVPQYPSCANKCFSALNTNRAHHLFTIPPAPPAPLPIAPLEAQSWYRIPNAIEWHALWTFQRRGVVSYGNYYVFHLPTLVEDVLSAQEITFYTDRACETTDLPLHEAAIVYTPAARALLLGVDEHLAVRDATYTTIAAELNERSRAPYLLMREHPDEYLVVNRTKLNECLRKAYAHASKADTDQLRKPRPLGVSAARRTLALKVPLNSFGCLAPDTTEVHTLWREEGITLDLEPFINVPVSLAVGKPKDGVHRVNGHVFLPPVLLRRHALLVNNSELTRFLDFFEEIVHRRNLTSPSSWLSALIVSEHEARSASGVLAHRRPVFTVADDEFLLKTWKAYLHDRKPLELQFPTLSKRHIDLRGKLLMLLRYRNKEQEPTTVIRDKELLTRALKKKEWETFQPVLEFKR